MEGKPAEAKKGTLYFNTFNGTFFGVLLKHFDFAQGPTNQVSSPALGSTAVQRAGKRKWPSSNGHPQGEWHLRGQPWKAPKLKLRAFKLEETLCNQLLPALTLKPSYSRHCSLVTREDGRPGPKTNRVPTPQTHGMRL